MKRVEQITKVTHVNDVTISADDSEDVLVHKVDEPREGSILSTELYTLAGGSGKTDIDDLTDDPNGHDGHPGGATPSSTEVWGHAWGETIDHSDVNIGQTIWGFGGDDTLLAGEHDDVVFGGIGNDSIDLNTGDDIGVGGAGDDFVIGWDGNDDIHLGTGTDTAWAGEGDDRVFLEDDGDVDTILFTIGEGQDVVDNFELGCDVVQLGVAYGFDSFDDIASLISYNELGDQAYLDLGPDGITFTNLDGQLGEADFLF